MVDVHEKTLSKFAYLLVLFIWLIGGALTGVGVLLYLQTNSMGTTVNNELAPLKLVLMAIGGVLLLTALLGLIGVCRKKSIMLSAFLAAMIIVLLAQFAAVVILFMFESSLSYYLEDGMRHSLLFYGKEGENVKFTDSWDYVQETQECCGQYGWQDYTTKNASNWFSTKFGSLPDSCCEVHTEGCGEDVVDKAHLDQVPKGIYDEGCYDITKDFLERWMTIAGSGALAFMFIQVLTIFLNISLQRRYREHEDYQLQSSKVKQVKDQQAPGPGLKDQAPGNTGSQPTV